MKYVIPMGLALPLCLIVLFAALSQGWRHPVDVLWVYPLAGLACGVLVTLIVYFSVDMYGEANNTAQYIAEHPEYFPELWTEVDSASRL